jgi:hypothetical protein
MRGGAYSATSSDNVMRGGAAYSATSSDNVMRGNTAYSATSSDNVMRGNTAYSATSSDNVMRGGAYSATSSDNVMRGGAYSATSPDNVMRGGAAFSATSPDNITSSKNVNKLLSMLTSESSNNALSNTSTQSLENQLRDILNQDGGSKTHKKSKAQSGGNNMKVDDIKNFFVNLKNQGVNVDLKLNNKTMSDFFNLADNTTTDFNETSSVFIGGAKKSSKKASKKASKKGSKVEMDGGLNAGIQAFLDLKKFIADKLGVPNGKEPAKIAGAVKREVQEKNPNMDTLKVYAEARVLFEKNMDRFKKMLSK